MYYFYEQYELKEYLVLSQAKKKPGEKPHQANITLEESKVYKVISYGFRAVQSK